MSRRSLVRQPGRTPPTTRSAGCSAAATPCTGTRRAAAWAPTPRCRTRSTWPGSSRSWSRATPGRSCSTPTRRSGPRSGSRSSPGPTSPARTTPALREWFATTTPTTRSRAGLAKLKAPSPGGRRAPRAALRGAGAEEHRVQRARRGAQPALRVRRRASPTRPPARRSGPRHRELYLQATTRPGAKLPHAWLVGADGHRVSTLDVTGKGKMTLLTGLSGQAWKHAAQEAGPAVPAHRRGRRTRHHRPVRLLAPASARSTRPARSWSAPTATSPGGRAPPSGTTTEATAPAQDALADGPRPAASTRSPARTRRARVQHQRRSDHRAHRRPAGPAEPRRAPHDRRSPHDRPAPTPASGPTWPRSSSPRASSQAGPYRTRYLHAGDTSKPMLLMLHGITGHAEAYVRNLAAHAEHFSVLGDRLHRPRLLHQARPPAGDPALRRPGHPRPGHPRRREGLLLRRVPRRLGHRPVRASTTRSRSTGSCSTPWAAPWPTPR